VASGEDTLSKLIAVVDATFLSLLGRLAARDVESADDDDNDGGGGGAGGAEGFVGDVIAEDVASGLEGALNDGDRVL
jgi:hypothetical protein